MRKWRAARAICSAESGGPTGSPPFAIREIDFQTAVHHLPISSQLFPIITLLPGGFISHPLTWSPRALDLPPPHKPYQRHGETPWVCMVATLLDRSAARSCRQRAANTAETSTHPPAADAPGISRKAHKPAAAAIRERQSAAQHGAGGLPFDLEANVLPLRAANKNQFHG